MAVKKLKDLLRVLLRVGDFMEFSVFAVRCLLPLVVAGVGVPCEKDLLLLFC